MPATIAAAARHRAPIHRERACSALFCLPRIFSCVTCSSHLKHIARAGFGYDVTRFSPARGHHVPPAFQTATTLQDRAVAIRLPFAFRLWLAAFAENAVEAASKATRRQSQLLQTDRLRHPARSLALCFKLHRPHALRIWMLNSSVEICLDSL